MANILSNAGVVFLIVIRNIINPSFPLQLIFNQLIIIHIEKLNNQLISLDTHICAHIHIQSQLNNPESLKNKIMCNYSPVIWKESAMKREQRIWSAS